MLQIVLESIAASEILVDFLHSPVQGFERDNLVITAPSPGTEGERSVVDVRTLERREKYREPIAFPALQGSQFKVTANRQYTPFL